MRDCSELLLDGVHAADVGKPCVLVNCRDRGMRLDAVLPDHFLIGEYSANYLIEMGHRQILSLMCLRRSTMERRLDGIREAGQSTVAASGRSRHSAEHVASLVERLQLLAEQFRGNAQRG